ncbi:MAG: hypothetical protein IKY92_03805 [Akkermansia sp.]|nr:hypothetical protein [Akkermansia sp.]
MAENKENAQPGGGAVRYEIRKGGVVCCASYLPLCGYDLLTIKKMQEAGYELYADGKKVRR